MVRLLFISVLFVAFLAAPGAVASDVIAPACDDPELWIISAVSTELWALLCSIQDHGDPFEISGENNGSGAYASPQTYEGKTQQPTLPEETKQQLLLLLLVWSQR